MKRVLAASLVAVLAAWLTGCEQSKPTATAPATAAAAAPPPPSVSPSPDASFVASGPLVVENQLDVASQRDGVVARILAEPGTQVKSGQLLAQLDDRQIAADRDAADAKVRAMEAALKGWEGEVKVLESDRERAEKMWEAQLITKEDLDHARFKVEADQYEAERARANLKDAQASARSLALEQEKTRIVAPFNGVVARRYVRVGQKVAVGDRMFWVTAVAPLRVKFTLPERFVGQIKKGQELEAVSADAPAVSCPAKVIQVSPVVDPSSGTIEVLAELVGPGQELRPGMTVNLRFHHPQ